MEFTKRELSYIRSLERSETLHSRLRVVVLAVSVLAVLVVFCLALWLDGIGHRLRPLKRWLAAGTG